MCWTLRWKNGGFSTKDSIYFSVRVCVCVRIFHVLIQNCNIRLQKGWYLCDCAQAFFCLKLWLFNIFRSQFIVYVCLYYITFRSRKKTANAFRKFQCVQGFSKWIKFIEFTHIVKHCEQFRGKVSIAREKFLRAESCWSQFKLFWCVCTFINQKDSCIFASLFAKQQKQIKIPSPLTVVCVFFNVLQMHDSLFSSNKRK